MFAFNFINAQEMTIKSVSLNPLDKTALDNICYDFNGDTCALLKIKTDHIEGIQFTNTNQYIKSTYSDGIYSVYVPYISRKLDFTHKDYMPFQLDMADYGFRRLKKGNTYMIILDVPHHKELISTIVIKVMPKVSRVIFDKEDYGINPNGTFEIPATSGKHNYIVSADDHLTQNGMVTVEKSEAKTVTVRLKPIMHEVLIGCNIDKARVFVDNVDYGNIGKMQIPQGIHNIRVQADGYVDEEKEVSVSSTTGSIYFMLKENKRVTHIHATPVTIYSGSSGIYKNNKKIKEWTNGATIMFMPGKYILSDDDGNSKKIVVGSKPMEIRL